jgi:D-alanyl-D-alanine carboxypeptidase
MRPARRSVLVRTAAVGGVLVAAAAVWFFTSRGPGIVIPADPCATRPPLRTADGVRLQPVAMRAFNEAERLAGRRIDVVQSYRSCHQQAKACRTICGDVNGCPGTCASPGRSAHQLGAAIDVTQAMLDDPHVRSALERSGWCEPLPSSDPGHFSYGGCR